MRHAKSDWSNENLDDHDRPLNARGVANANRLAEYLHAQGIRPDHILCSTATRARETLAPMLALLGNGVDVKYESRLYMAAAPAMLKMVTGLPATAKSAMIVGHNPGIHALALALGGRGDPLLLTELASKYPTGATTVLAFDTDAWRDVDAGRGMLKQFIRPKALV
jgi:phosphohistidine phosphatase